MIEQESNLMLTCPHVALEEQHVAVCLVLAKFEDELSRLPVCHARIMQACMQDTAR